MRNMFYALLLDLYKVICVCLFGGDPCQGWRWQQITILRHFKPHIPMLFGNFFMITQPIQGEFYIRYSSFLL